MALNYIWIAFFIIAFAVALFRTIFGGDAGVWSEIMSASFTSSATAFEISLGLTGILSLWLGLMKIGRGQGNQFLRKNDFASFLPSLSGCAQGASGHGFHFHECVGQYAWPRQCSHPIGVEGHAGIAEAQQEKDTATDAMIMFLILNASGLCFIPISIMMYRAQAGAANPTDIFLPILLATFVSTLVGIVALCLKQRIRLTDPVLLAWLAGMGV